LQSKKPGNRARRGLGPRRAPCEEIGFDDNERKKIIAIESQLSQWKEVIKLAFYKHYVAAKNPPESEAKYFQELIEETRRDLKNSSYDSYTQKMRDKYQRGKL